MLKLRCIVKVKFATVYLTRQRKYLEMSPYYIEKSPSSYSVPCTGYGKQVFILAALTTFTSFYTYCLQTLSAVTII